jgi:hypothetical protein
MIADEIVPEAGKSPDHFTLDFVEFLWLSNLSNFVTSSSARGSSCTD